MSAPKTEGELAALLRARFPAPEYAFLGNVRNTTGHTRQAREADGVAMGLWPSRGLDLHGFEIKSARSDWLREKANPAKAEEIAGKCDFWWLVTAGPEVAKVDELPPAWGLLIPVERGGAWVLKPAREPTRLDQPKAVSRGFLAAILRRAQQESPGQAEIDAAVAVEHKRLLAIMEGDRLTAIEERDKSRRAESQVRELEWLQKRVAEFREVSGVDISQAWNLGDMGEAVRHLVDHGALQLAKRLKEQVRILRNLTDLADRAADALEGPAPECHPSDDDSHDWQTQDGGTGRICSRCRTCRD